MGTATIPYMVRAVSSASDDIRLLQDTNGRYLAAFHRERAGDDLWYYVTGMGAEPFRVDMTYTNGCRGRLQSISFGDDKVYDV